MLKQNLMLLGIVSLLILQIIVIPQVYAMEVFDTIDVGESSIQITLNPTTNTIYVTNRDNTISVIGGSDNIVVDTIDVGTSPRGIAVNPTTNTIYVTNPLDGTVSVIGGSDKVVVDTIEVGTLPRGIAVNPTTNMIYVTIPSNNTILVIDGSDNMVVDTIDVGTLPRGIAVNPTTNMIYVTNPLDNTVSVFDGSTNGLMDIIDVVDGSFGIALNPTTNMIYVVSCFYGINAVSVIDGSNNSVMDSLNLKECASTLAINPLTNTFYIPSSSDNTISVVGEDVKLSGIKTPQEPFTTSDSVEGIGKEVALQKIKTPNESIPIQIAEELVQNPIDSLPYLGIVVLGAIIGVIGVKKRNNGKPKEISQNNEHFYKPKRDFEKESKSIARKLQDRLVGSQSDIIKGLDLDQMIENKIRIILKLQQYKLGNYNRLEGIKKSLITDGIFTKKDNEYVESTFEQYKKIALIND